MDRKHCEKKEKMLVTSIFSFSHNVFRRPLNKGLLKVIFCGKELIKSFVGMILMGTHNGVWNRTNGYRIESLPLVWRPVYGEYLTLYHTIPTLMTLEKKPFENIVGKGENAVDQHILLFPQCFYPIRKNITI